MKRGRYPWLDPKFVFSFCSVTPLIPHSAKYYRAPIPRGREADTRAAEVPADYETKARKVDAEYNGLPYQRGGPPGPVLTLLRSLPPVTDLGVGFTGEFSREVGQFISAVAEKGAVVPGRFGCCHSSDQARGVIASFMRLAFGRTSLRGVARIRQAALTAILGGWVERRAPTPLLTAPWRVPRTHGARLAGTSTAVPAPVVNWRRDITAAPGAETGPLLT